MLMVGKVKVMSVGELIRVGYLMIGDGPWIGELKAFARYWLLVSEEKYALSWHDTTACYDASHAYVGQTKDRYAVSIEIDESEVPVELLPPGRPAVVVASPIKKK